METSIHKSWGRSSYRCHPSPSMPRPALASSRSRRVYGSLVPPKFSRLYLRITCASKDHLRLRPPHLRLRAPHLRLHFFLTYASLLLIENECTLSFHNAMILNLACYLNFIPPCPPQWLYLNPNSFFKLPPPCLPQCHHLKSNSLFKLPPPCLPQ